MYWPQCRRPWMRTSSGVRWKQKVDHIKEVSYLELVDALLRMWPRDIFITLNGFVEIEKWRHLNVTSSQSVRWVDVVWHWEIGGSWGGETKWEGRSYCLVDISFVKLLKEGNCRVCCRKIYVGRHWVGNLQIHYVRTGREWSTLGIREALLL